MVENESRNNPSLEDWPMNLGVGSVPQYAGGRKITYWEFTVRAAKIVRSLKRGAILEVSEQAEEDEQLQGIEII
jgi:hypothetical protein